VQLGVTQQLDSVEVERVFGLVIGDKERDITLVE
jgi:hypothetical protein